MSKRLQIIARESDGRETVLASVVGAVGEVTPKLKPDPLWLRALAGFVGIGGAVIAWGGSAVIDALGLTPAPQTQSEEEP